MDKLEFVLLTLCVLCVLSAVANSEGITYYSFTRYPYKKKPKNERRIKKARQDCEDKEDCVQAQGLQQTVCIRSCMSEKCYNEIYAPDPLEEGEIDVRFHSFKGCVLVNLPRPN